MMYRLEMGGTGYCIQSAPCRYRRNTSTVWPAPAPGDEPMQANAAPMVNLGVDELRACEQLYELLPFLPT